MSEVAQVPQLRFPEFNGDLEEKKLDDVGSFKSGTGFTEAEQGGKSGVPFFKVSDMNLEGNQKVMVSANNYVNDEQIARLNYKPINKKSVIFAKVGAAVFLERKRIADSFLIDNNMMAFTPTEDIDFIRQWFDTVRLSKYAQVGALPSYNASDLKTIKINLPALPEQTKIASFLTTVDNKIEQLSKKQELLGEYKKGLMQQIFSQAIRFKADDGSAFPVWEEKKLGDIGHTFNGLTGKTKDDFGRGKPYIQYMQIFESSKINIDNFGLVDVRDDENQKVAQYGDVFFTTSSETPDAVGYSSVLLDDIDKLYLNSFCFGFRPNSLDELSPNFAQFLLRSANFRRRVVRLAQGSTRYNMSKVQLMKEVISLPCLKEQTKIANFLSSIDTKIEQVGKQLDESKQFKKALLQKMFV